MTTVLNKPVMRVLPVVDRRTRRHLVAMLEGGVVRIWLKGCRRNRAYVVPWESIFMMGAKIERRKARKANK